MPYPFAGHIGIGKETTWGTGVAASDYVEAMEENMPIGIDRFETKTIIGTYAAPDDSAGLHRIQGSLTVPVHPVTIGYFLHGAFGQNSVTEVLSGFLWTHKFNIQQSDTATNAALPGYTLEVHRDVTSSQQFAGCLFSQLEFNLAPNQDLRCTAQIIGKSHAQIAATTPTFPGSPTFPFLFDTASISIGGVASELFESVSVMLNNNLEAVPALNNSNVISRIKRAGFPLVTISGTMEFTDETELNNFVNQTEQAITLSVTKADSFQLVFDLPRVVWTAFPVAMSGTGRIVVDVEGRARYHTGSATQMEVRLTNTVSGY